MGFKHVKVEDNTGMSASTKRHHRKYNHEQNALVFSQYMYFLLTSSPAALFFFLFASKVNNLTSLYPKSPGLQFTPPRWIPLE